MKETIVNRHIIRSSLIVLTIGLIALTAGRAKAQPGQHIEILSYAFGSTELQTVRISMTLPRLPNRQQPGDPLNIRIQVLGTEGEVLAQSSEIRVAPGQTRFWDVPGELLRTSEERTGRHQVSVRFNVMTPNLNDAELLMPAIEVLNNLTGETTYHMAGKRFLIFATGPLPPGEG